MEKHHEIIKPIRDIVRGIGEYVVEKVLPQVTFDNFLNGPDNSPLDEPVFSQQEFAYDSEGGWVNLPPAPDIAGKDL